MAPLRFTAPLTVTLRSPDVVQVGLDGARGLLLPDAPRGADVALRAIDRGCSPARAALELHPCDRDWLPAALAALRSSGLVTEEPPPPRVVAVVGIELIEVGKVHRMTSSHGRAWRAATHGGTTASRPVVGSGSSWLR